MSCQLSEFSRITIGVLGTSFEKKVKKAQQFRLKNVQYRVEVVSGDDECDVMVGRATVDVPGTNVKPCLWILGTSDVSKLDDRSQPTICYYDLTAETVDLELILTAALDARIQRFILIKKYNQALSHDLPAILTRRKPTHNKTRDMDFETILIDLVSMLNVIDSFGDDPESNRIEIRALYSLFMLLVEYCERHIRFHQLRNSDALMIMLHETMHLFRKYLGDRIQQLESMLEQCLAMYAEEESDVANSTQTNKLTYQGHDGYDDLDEKEQEQQLTQQQQEGQLLREMFRDQSKPFAWDDEFPQLFVRQWLNNPEDSELDNDIDTFIKRANKHSTQVDLDHFIALLESQFDSSELMNHKYYLRQCYGYTTSLRNNLIRMLSMASASSISAKNYLLRVINILDVKRDLTLITMAIKGDTSPLQNLSLSAIEISLTTRFLLVILPN
jgi:hypothetical protein